MAGPSWAHRAGTEESERIILCAGIIDCDVPKHVFADFLGQINIDAKEVGWKAKHPHYVNDMVKSR